MPLPHFNKNRRLCSFSTLSSFPRALVEPRRKKEGRPRELALERSGATMRYGSPGSGVDLAPRKP